MVNVWWGGGDWTAALWLPRGCRIGEHHELFAKDLFKKKKKQGVETVPAPHPRVTELMMPSHRTFRSPVSPTTPLHSNSSNVKTWCHQRSTLGSDDLSGKWPINPDNGTAYSEWRNQFLLVLGLWAPTKSIPALLLPSYLPSAYERN